MASLSHELGIDLGTLNTRIVEGKDILLQEPTIVAIFWMNSNWLRLENQRLI